MSNTCPTCGSAALARMFGTMSYQCPDKWHDTPLFVFTDTTAYATTHRSDTTTEAVDAPLGDEPQSGLLDTPEMNDRVRTLHGLAPLYTPLGDEWEPKHLESQLATIDQLLAKATDYPRCSHYLDTRDVMLFTTLLANVAKGALTNIATLTARLATAEAERDLLARNIVVKERTVEDGTLVRFSSRREEVEDWIAAGHLAWAHDLVAKEAGK